MISKGTSERPNWLMFMAKEANVSDGNYQRKFVLIFKLLFYYYLD